MARTTTRIAQPCAQHRHGELLLAPGDSCPVDCQLQGFLGRIQNQVNAILALATESREATENHSDGVMEGLSFEAVNELVRLAAAGAIEELAALERLIYRGRATAPVSIAGRVAEPKAVAP